MLSKREWSIIANHVVGERKTMMLICKAAKGGFEISQTQRENNQDCLKCGNKLLNHIHEEDNDECEDTLCISSATNGTFVDRTWLICEYCFAWYLLCDECERFANVETFSCIKSEGCQEMRLNQITFKLEKRNNHQNGDIYENDCYILKIPSCWDMKYINTEYWLATGPDGGLYHSWKCRACNKNLGSFSDK